ncbi:MAG: site-specific integrase [Bryobacteraceae bacterium]|nr:site-specific integrase [Bryobacteraceae bacterium]
MRAFRFPGRSGGKCRRSRPDQARKFLAVVRGTQHGALFELALTTGLRPSEYCALKWDDINFERGTLSFVRSIDFQPGGGWLLEETKTKGSRRVVRLLPSALHALAGHKLRQEEDRERAGDDWLNEGFVFTNERALRWTGMTLRTGISKDFWWKPDCLRSGSTICAIRLRRCRFRLESR